MALHFCKQGYKKTINLLQYLQEIRQKKYITVKKDILHNKLVSKVYEASFWFQHF